jgi:hypothetical protein
VPECATSVGDSCATTSRRTRTLSGACGASQARCLRSSWASRNQHLSSGMALWVLGPQSCGVSGHCARMTRTALHYGPRAARGRGRLGCCMPGTLTRHRHRQPPVRRSRCHAGYGSRPWTKRVSTGVRTGVMASLFQGLDDPGRSASSGLGMEVRVGMGLMLSFWLWMGTRRRLRGGERIFSRADRWPHCSSLRRGGRSHAPAKPPLRLSARRRR